MTDTDMSASEPEIHVNIDIVVQLKTKLYDKKTTTRIWSIHLSVDTIFRRISMKSGLLLTRMLLHQGFLGEFYGAII